MMFQEGFEKYAPHMVYAAWDFTGNSDRVDMVWIHYLCYKHSDGTLLRTTPVYRVGDEIVTASYLHTVLPDVPLDNDALGELFGEIADYGRQWAFGCNEGEFPSRTILRFRPSDEDFSADFYYGHPLAGIPEKQRGAITDAVDVWMERLRATGDDSAEL